MSIGSFNQSDMGEIANMIDEGNRNRMLRQFNHVLNIENSSTNTSHNQFNDNIINTKGSSYRFGADVQSHCEKKTQEDTISYST